MRKFLVIGLLTMPVVFLATQPAAAWVKFGGSFNASWGGNKCYKEGGNPPGECSYRAVTPPCCPAPCCCVPKVNACAPQAPHVAAPQAPAAKPIQPVDYQWGTWNGYSQQYGYYYYPNYSYPQSYQPMPGVNFDFPAWFFNNN